MTESNFFFLTNEWSSIYVTAHKAESYVVTEPTVSAFLSRKALEEMLSWLFDNDGSLQLPDKEKFTLNDLLWEQSFKESWGKEYGKDLNQIRQSGNSAAHKGGTIPANEAMASVKNLFRFCSGIVRTFSENPYQYRPFDESIIPSTGHTASKKMLEQVTQDAALKHLELERRKAELSEKEDELAKIKAKLEYYEKKSAENGVVKAPAVLSEAETRKLYIDIMLREAGWDADAPNVREFAVQAEDEATGVVKTLKIDYVIWGDDGKPWALIEAKRTTAEVERGRSQARNYADALEKKYGQRPLIYYTNGFDTFLWDDAQYPPRAVFGFLNSDEIQRLLVRRTQRGKLSEQKVNQSIANRYYQERAIRRVAERFEADNQRKALLVMATGTGKTRVSAAIVDMLTKAQWAKRILFLADRNALVTQALKNYNKYLPNLTGIDLTKDKDQGSARVVFSTYQTIINKIDTDYRNGKRYYGVGHFDLVIIDEAHRSVYDKFGAIFNYFDALYLGLTATPKNETDRDTYRLFNHTQGEPTDAYEYVTAVEDKFLSPVKKVPLVLKFPSQGIRYNNLTEDEKREYERKFYDPATGQVPDEIDSGAINKWLFNEDTVDKILVELFRSGYKVEGGDKLGKTIIFARSHKHAEFIYERFNILYPHLDGKFAEIIDNIHKDPQKAIDNFSVATKFPQIAISVDMLDTGIDVPEILNLVFFKPVYSAAKFWQMLGRGTRLSPEVFGAGSPETDKKDFYVFDVCANFDRFELNPEGVVPSRSRSLTESLFLARTELVYLLQTVGDPLPDSSDFKTRQELAAMLCRQVSVLDQNGFEVRLRLRHVEQYSNADAWSNLKQEDVSNIGEHVAPIMTSDEPREQVKRFDLMMAQLQLAVLRQSNAQVRYIEKLQGYASELLRKDNIPQIAKKREMLTSILQPEFWANASVTTIEHVRQEIRDLSKLLDPDSGQSIHYTNFTDEITVPVTVQDFTVIGSGYTSLHAKLRKIVQDNAGNLTIHRLHTNQPITAAELDDLDRMLFEQSGLQTHEEFKEALGEKPLGVFIRSVLGMDSQSANDAFAEFLANGALNSFQISFVKDLIQMFTQDGKVDREMLWEQPFTKFHQEGVSGIFPLDTSRKIIEIIDDVNRRAYLG